MNYREQIRRIKKKLKIAKKTDKQLKVFGAKSHKYLIHKPIDESHLVDFEKEYHVSLPNCYTTFLTEIGNSGCSYLHSAAGPFYGIYPFGKNIGELTEYPQEYLCQAVKIYPTMTNEYWAELIQRIEEDDDISDDEYERELGKIYAGILPIGSQGCTYLHGLLLNGSYKGKVVNLNLDLQQPHFTYEDNFLDWYERWLDEVISGDLLADGPTWFGYSMGGTDQELINKYGDSSNTTYKLECLSGLLHKAKLSPETVDTIEQECFNRDRQLSHTALQLLTKTDYARAKPILHQTYQEAPLKVFQYVYWYAKASSEDWISEITQILTEKNIDSELFRFVTYLIAECQTDLSELVKPFTEHDDEGLQTQARYILEKLGSRA